MMDNKFACHDDFMWNKPWRYKEGIAVCMALLLVGLMLQLCIGPINWDVFAMPVNVVLLILYILSLLAAYILRGKMYFVRWSMTYHAAVPAIFVAGVATVVYGITCDRIALSSWHFILLYFWLSTILGLTCFRQLHQIVTNKQSLASSLSLISHLGLFIVIVAATLGSADVQKLRMAVRQGDKECRAMDDGGVHELDIAIQLNSFTIEEYPPKLIAVDNETGTVLSSAEGKKMAPLELDGEHSYEYNGVNIRLRKLLPYCEMVETNDSIYYRECSDSGATTAALVDIVSLHGKEKRGLWISNGSYLYPYRTIRIDDKTSLVMLEYEPKRFTSNVSVFGKSGETVKNVDIEVNRPLDIGGYKIYQVSYDKTKGRWSDVSIFELVRDPWLPVVYAGVFMLLAGAVLMFLVTYKK